MKIQYILMALLLASVIGCVKDDNFSEPDIAQIKDKYKNEAQSFTGERITYQSFRTKATTQINLYTDNDAFEGYVISSDESGNFYKKIYIQSPDKSGTIAVAMEQKGLFGMYPIGSKVQVRLKGMSFWYNSRYSIIEVGYGQGVTAGGNIKILNLPSSMHKNVIPMGEELSIQQLATEFTDLSQINASYVNKLVVLKNVHFEQKAVGQPFHLKTNKYGTSYKLQDQNSGTLTFNTSGFATYVQELVPSGSLNIIGVITQAGRNIQININSIQDIQVNN